MLNFKIKNKRKNSGITLIALIVSIIVLIILAGVSINLILGENGLLKKAVNSVSQYNEKEAEERLSMALADLQAKKLIDNSYNTDSYIINYLESQGFIVDDDIITVGNYQFEINKENLEITENMGKASPEILQQPRVTKLNAVVENKKDVVVDIQVKNVEGNNIKYKIEKIKEDNTLELKEETEKIGELTYTFRNLETETVYKVTVEVTNEHGTKGKSTQVQTDPVVKVNSITLNEEKITIGKTQTKQLSVEAIGPEDAEDKTYSWDSLNKDIATVSTTGLVTGVAEGEATIRCTSTDGGKYVDCKVTVVNGITISNRAELEAIKNNLSGSYILIADIDLSDSNWSPIGNSNAFSGILDGNGHTISNMTISFSDQNTKAFIRKLSGTIKNLKFVNCIVKNTYKYSDNSDRTGIIFAEITGNARLENVAVVGGRVTKCGNMFGIFRKRERWRVSGILLQ